MIGGTVITDIEQWSGEVGSLLEDLAGKSSVAGPSSATSGKSTSVDLGVDPLPEVSAALGTITALTNLAAARSALNNTSAMEQAAEAAKIQALRDAAAQAIAHAKATGDFSGVELLLS